MHMLEAAREGRKPHKDFEIFEERVQSDGYYDDRRNSDERVRKTRNNYHFLFLFIYPIIS